MLHYLQFQAKIMLTFAACLPTYSYFAYFKHRLVFLVAFFGIFFQHDFLGHTAHEYIYTGIHRVRENPESNI